MATAATSRDEAKALMSEPSEALSQRSRLSRRQSSGMESSVLRFNDVNFTVGKGDKQRHLLQDVTGKIQYGRKWLLLQSLDAIFLNVFFCLIRIF